MTETRADMNNIPQPDPAGSRTPDKNTNKRPTSEMGRTRWPILSLFAVTSSPSRARHRLSLVFASVLLFANVITASAASSDASVFANLRKKVSGVYKDWKLFDDFMKYAEEFTRTGKKPEKIPKGFLGDELLLSRLQKAHDQVKAIQFPAEPNRPPHTIDDLSGSNVERRAALSGGTKWLIAEDAVIKERDLLMAQLDELLKRAKLSLDASRVLEEGLRKVAPFNNTLALSWASLMADLNPKLGDVVSEIEAKKGALAILIRSSQTAFEDIGHGYRLLVDEESGILFQESWDVQKLHSEQMDKLKELAQRESDNNDELREINQELRGLDRSLAQANRPLKRVENVIASYKDKRNSAYRIRLSTVGYSYCTNREPFSTCTHEDLKAQWYRDKARESDERIRQLDIELRDARQELAELRADVAQAKRAYDEAASPLKEQRASIQKDQTSLEKAKTPLLSRLKALTAQQKSLHKLHEASIADANRLWNLGFRRPSNRVPPPPSN